MANTEKPFQKPDGLVQQWSKTQGMQWIKACVRAGNLKFSVHARAESAKDHDVSHDDAKETILKGLPIRWELGIVPNTGDPSMKMTFERKLTSRSISVVAAIEDDDPNVVVITVWDKKS